MKLFALLGLLSFKNLALADIPTPDPNDDPTQNGQDMFDVLKNIISKEAAPVLIYGGMIFFVCAGVFEIYRGYKVSQKEDDMGKFKTSLITGVILLVLGGSMFFLAQYIDQQWQGGN